MVYDIFESEYDSQLMYQIHLAESELYNNMIICGSKVINESSGLMSINEDVKETITTYINKIIDAIGKAFSKFKSLFDSAKNGMGEYLNKIKDKLNNADPKFTIENFPQYNISGLKQISLVPYNYEEMKDILTVDEFIQKFYPSLVGEGTLAEKIKKKCITGYKDIKCTSDVLKDMFKFITTDFKEHSADLDKDQKTMEASKNQITTIANTVVSAQQNVGEAVIIYRSFLEDGEKKEPIKFVDDPDRQDSQGEGKTAVVKNITLYCKVNSQIISAKMATLRSVYADYIKVLKHFISPKSVGIEDNKEKK